MKFMRILICVKTFTMALCIFFNLSLFAGIYVGKGSYGKPTVLFQEADLYIGKYCSFADGVMIMLGGEHRPDWVTTFPFSVFWKAQLGPIPGHPKTKGDVIIGNDVWVAREALILSGVTIGNGAVVGARSVVAKDVPPYAIVAGNPAKLIRFRFDEETIRKLEAIAWWNWPENEILEAAPYMLSDDINAFIDYCIQIGKFPTAVQ